jgi:hypothetical protein
VRSQLGTIPGASAPLLMGGNVRTIVISANAKKLRQSNISGDQIVRALASGSRSRAGAPGVTLSCPQAEASELTLPAD